MIRFVRLKKQFVLSLTNSAREDYNRQKNKFKELSDYELL